MNRAVGAVLALLPAPGVGLAAGLLGVERWAQRLTWGKCLWSSLLFYSTSMLVFGFPFALASGKGQTDLGHFVEVSVCSGDFSLLRRGADT